MMLCHSLRLLCHSQVIQPYPDDNQNDKNYHADEEYGDDDDGHNIKFKYRATKYLFPILLEAKCQFISN